jgi:hypothetical protein
MAQLGVDANYKQYDPQVVTSGLAALAFPAVTQGLIVKPSKIFVQAWSLNTGIIHIGKSTVQADGTTGGYELVAGSSLILPHTEIASWYHIASLAGQKLFITYMSGVY